MSGRAQAALPAYLSPRRLARTARPTAPAPAIESAALAQKRRVLWLGWPSPVRGSVAAGAAAAVGGAAVVGVDTAAGLVGVAAGATVLVAVADAVGVAAYDGAGWTATVASTAAPIAASTGVIQAFLIRVEVFKMLPLLRARGTPGRSVIFTSGDETHMKIL